MLFSVLSEKTMQHVVYVETHPKEQPSLLSDTFSISTMEELCTQLFCFPEVQAFIHNCSQDSDFVSNTAIIIIILSHII